MIEGADWLGNQAIRGEGLGIATHRIHFTQYPNLFGSIDAMYARHDVKKSDVIGATCTEEGTDCAIWPPISKAALATAKDCGLEAGDVTGPRWVCQTTNSARATRAGAGSHFRKLQPRGAAAGRSVAHTACIIEP